MHNFALDDIVHKVFPPESCLTADVSSPDKAQYLVVPGRGGIWRWILPADPKLGMPGLRFWKPYDVPSRLKWRAILAAYRLGGLHRLPGVRRITVEGPALWTHAGIDRPVAPVIYLGEPWERAKAIVFLLDAASHECLGVAKLPVGAAAAPKVLNEAEALVRLAAEKPGMAPACIFQDPQAGIALQSIVPVRNTGRRIGQEHIDWLSKLETPDSASLSCCLESLLQRRSAIQGMSASEQNDFDRLVSLAADETPLPRVWQHGDFAPWNFKRLPDGGHIAIDWEDATPDGVPLYDLLHFHVIQSDTAAARTAFEAMLAHPATVAYMARLGIDRGLAEKIAHYFMADYWIRRFEEADEALTAQWRERVRAWLENCR